MAAKEIMGVTHKKLVHLTTILQMLRWGKDQNREIRMVKRANNRDIRMGGNGK